jgi:hypothetical protein
MKLRLERPIIFFDLETTGTNVNRDRIVELSVVKVFPDGSTEEKTRLINPGMPIPPGATAVHHITDADVADAPTFPQIARSLNAIFEGCDIAGFNSNKFDIPLLIEEFQRAGIHFDLSGRRCVDVQNIFHKMEPRTLVAAVKFYCGRDLADAHSSLADTRATYEVLLGQLDRYPELENDVDFLSRFSSADGSMDIAGRIRRNEAGVPVFTFGKYRDTPVDEVLDKEPSYYEWIIQGDFSKNTKDVLRQLKYRHDAAKKTT